MRAGPLLLALSLAAGILAGAAAQDAGTLLGRVELLDKGGRRTADGEDATLAVVWFEPAAGAPAVRPGQGELVTRGKRFEPGVLVVPRGSRVRFPNEDPILHNVFSISPGNAFDLGLVRRGESGETVFTTPGVARIFCNVHHDMVAHVVVLDTRWSARPAADGSFRLDRLPGPGRLHVWHERAEAVELEVRPGGPPVTVSLEISRPRIPPHLDKLGRRYGRSRDRY